MDGPPPATPRSLTVRVARSTDVDRLLEIHVAAFPDPRPLEVRRRLFLHNRMGGLANLWVVERAGELVGHAFSFPVGVWFGGRVVAGRAVASVGVAVESRGQGVARALMEAIHAEARDHGDVFTLLYPFRQAFYARLGYAPLARQRVLTVSPRAIPSAWRASGPWAVRRAGGLDRPQIARVYRAAARLGTGFVERPDRAWEHDFLEERQHWLVLSRGDGLSELSGYLSVRLTQPEPHARVRAEVRDLVASDDDARRRLLGALGALGDQVGDVTLALADDDPLDWALLDGDRDRGGTKEVEHALGVVSTGPMLRLVDPRRALAARGYEASGSVDLDVDGDRFTLDVRDGVGRISTADAAATPTLAMTAATLASVAFGGLRLEDAHRLGWLGDHAVAAVRESAPLLRLPPFFSLDSF